MIKIMLEVIWMLLPAIAANMAPVFTAKILPDFNYPLDFGVSLKGTRIFGKNKTVKGLISGMVFAVVVYCVQVYFSHNLNYLNGISLLTYSYSFWYIGALLGFGTLMGDAIKSFFKRRVGIASGSPWFPLDQIDWIIGALITCSFFTRVSILLVIVSLPLNLIGHLVVKSVGYLIGVNSRPI